MEKIRKCITKILQQINERYPSETVGQIIERAVGRDNLMYVTDEELLELLERYLEHNKINYS